MNVMECVQEKKRISDRTAQMVSSIPRAGFSGVQDSRTY